MLLERGVYSPIELLLAGGLLSEDGHDAWLTGERASLDEALPDPSAARAVLEEAAAFARDLGLVAGAGERRAAVSGDPGLDALLRRTYRRAGDDPQGDLFLDNTTIVTVNALRNALVSTDATAAREHLASLTKLEPRHPCLAQAEALIAALEAPPPDGQGDALDRRVRLAREWMPAAAALLGADGQRFLAPLWRGVALALEGRDFDPGDPDGHASWTFRQCLDWEAVRRTVRGVPDYADRPVLVGRLAEAEYALQHRVEAVRLWFALCSTAPRHFVELVRRPDFPDTGMAAAWRQAMDADELAEDLSPEWFPAWMLIREPGLAQVLPPAPGTDGPARTFNLLWELRRGADSDERRVQLRAGLKAVHSGPVRELHEDVGVIRRGDERAQNEERRHRDPYFDARPTQGATLSELKLGI